ncbi:uncharacterized protein MELLADRAFT_106466 [Melampsora larici-populina 98AG31]|uniref:Uncharacterized protein n=1 Tax=Melampsora larici-populina (strain 98AG31 / pathotype 3-4-7) TaxID=747676 RepID=F4RLL1_MELLP|nr:uncharacterized protein MELLADRAFT_106466 [Melampsora larici-populina 98AG31]EGG06731.1 hypothetical protein MELLADRAFT_106466 [Melampsora larici-populina 98AG31]
MSTAELRAIRAARRVRGKVPAEDAQPGLAAPANPARSVQPASIDGQELGQDGLAEGAEEDRNTAEREEEEDDQGGQVNEAIDLIGAESDSQDSQEERHTNDGRYEEDEDEGGEGRGEEQDEPDHPSDSTSDSSDSSSDSSETSSTSSEEGSDKDSSDSNSSSSDREAKAKRVKKLKAKLKKAKAKVSKKKDKSKKERTTKKKRDKSDKLTEHIPLTVLFQPFVNKDRDESQKKKKGSAVKGGGTLVPNLVQQAKDRSARFHESNFGDSNPYALGGKLQFKDPETGERLYQANQTGMQVNPQFGDINTLKQRRTPRDYGVPFNSQMTTNHLGMRPIIRMPMAHNPALPQRPATAPIVRGNQSFRGGSGGNQGRGGPSRPRHAGHSLLYTFTTVVPIVTCPTNFLEYER